jgi:hypothetical protein
MDNLITARWSAIQQDTHTATQPLTPVGLWPAGVAMATVNEVGSSPFKEPLPKLRKNV